MARVASQSEYDGTEFIPLLAFPSIDVRIEADSTKTSTKGVRALGQGGP